MAGARAFAYASGIVLLRAGKTPAPSQGAHKQEHPGRCQKGGWDAEDLYQAGAEQGRHTAGSGADGIIQPIDAAFLEIGRAHV